MRHKPKINLRHDIGFGLIVLRRTGVIISNQTGGFACHHPEAEGFYIPLQSQIHPILSGHFQGKHGQWKGECSAGIDEVTAGLIDMVYADEFDVLGFTVDRAKFKESHEAWIYVDVWNTADSTDRDFEICYGFNKRKGILTWENSD